jgi:glycine/D-amino acid oxidase-like deaminating enzyme
MRERAQTVIIGAGIVGVSAAYHLTELGVADVLVLEQGPLFETGGSTSHAPGIIFQTNGSRTMCRIAQDSVALYDSLEVDGERCWYGVGGLELATSVERMQELKRRQGFARSYGLEGTELLTPAEAAERSPLLDPSTIMGAYWVPRGGQGREDRGGAGSESRGGRRGVRGRRHGDRVRRACGPRARGAHRPRHRGV